MTSGVEGATEVIVLVWEGAAKVVRGLVLGGWRMDLKTALACSIAHVPSNFCVSTGSEHWVHL